MEIIEEARRLAQDMLDQNFPAGHAIITELMQFYTERIEILQGRWMRRVYERSNN